MTSRGAPPPRVRWLRTPRAAACGRRRAHWLNRGRVPSRTPPGHNTASEARKSVVHTGARRTLPDHPVRLESAMCGGCPGSRTFASLRLPSRRATSGVLGAPPSTHSCGGSFGFGLHEAAPDSPFILCPGRGFGTTPATLAAIPGPGKHDSRCRERRLRGGQNDARRQELVATEDPLRRQEHRPPSRCLSGDVSTAKIEVSMDAGHGILGSRSDAASMPASARIVRRVDRLATAVEKLLEEPTSS